MPPAPSGGDIVDASACPGLHRRGRPLRHDRGICPERAARRWANERVCRRAARRARLRRRSPDACRLRSDSRRLRATGRGGGEASGSSSGPPASSTPATLMPGELVLATSGSANAGGGGTLLTGVLGGEVRGDHACLWLVPSDAPTSRVALVWPPGYHAYNDPPLQINAPDHRVIALAGATMSLNGVWISPGTGPTSDQDPCGIGSIFVVAGVVSNGGAVTPVTVAMPSARP